jgi:hypothetical protein
MASYSKRGQGWSWTVAPAEEEEEEEDMTLQSVHDITYFITISV